MHALQAKFYQFLSQYQSLVFQFLQQTNGK